MVQTTKSQSPFTQFDARYYNNLKRVSFEKAEEYRKSVTAPKKETIDLGKIHAERNEDFPTEHEVRGIEPTAEQQAHQPRPNTIDLGKQLENK